MMGQQQLLFLVLATVIVGIAIIVGINLFSQGAVKANEDAVRQDILVMMSGVEEHYKRPNQLDGGGGDFSNLASFADLGYRYNSDGSAVSGAEFVKDNGSYTLTPGDSPQIVRVLAEDFSLSLTYRIAFD